MGVRMRRLHVTYPLKQLGKLSFPVPRARKKHPPKRIGIHHGRFQRWTIGGPVLLPVGLGRVRDFPASRDKLLQGEYASCRFGLMDFVSRRKWKQPRPVRP